MTAERRSVDPAERMPSDETYIIELARLNNDLINARRELTKANIELNVQREELRRANEELKLLHTILRHDLANDLTVIEGAIGLWLANNDGRLLPRAGQAAERGRERLARMKELQASIVAGGALEPCDVGDVIRSATSTFAVRATIVGNGRVMADRGLSTVFENLAQNALVHGQATELVFGICEDEDHCIITVADNGRGMPREAMDKLFTEGYHFGETGHTGLGLFIIKNLVQRYGGSISARPNEPRGMVFTIVLPRLR